MTPENSQHIQSASYSPVLAKRGTESTVAFGTTDCLAFQDRYRIKEVAGECAFDHKGTSSMSYLRR